jgi:hypothetical protein
MTNQTLFILDLYYYNTVIDFIEVEFKYFILV